MEEVPGLVYTREGGVATIRLNRPERLNAITWEMVKGITRFVAEAGPDPDIRVVVITGTGRAFSSGDDIVSGMGDWPGTYERNALSPDRGPNYELVRTLLKIGRASCRERV